MGTATVTVTAGHGGTHIYTVPIPNHVGAQWMPPAGKIIWGQTRQGDVDAMAVRAAMYGSYLKRPGPFYPAGFHDYLTPAQANPASVAKALHNSVQVSISRGQFPHIDIKEAVSQSFADVASGKDDAALDAIFEGLATFGVPALVDFHNEPFGDSQGGPVDYGNAVARVAARRDAAGVRGLVAVTSAMQCEPFDLTDKDSQNDITPWLQATMPHVDAVNLHGYNHWSVGKPASKWYTPDQIFGVCMSVARKIDPTKPFCIGETGVRTDPANPGKAAAWMKAFYAWCIANNVVEVVGQYDADQNTNDGGTPWRMDYNGDGTDGTERWHAFADLAVDLRTWYPLRAA